MKPIQLLNVYYSTLGIKTEGCQRTPCVHSNSHISSARTQIFFRISGGSIDNTSKTASLRRSIRAYCVVGGSDAEISDPETPACCSSSSRMLPRRAARAALFSDCASLGGNSFDALSTFSNSIHMRDQSKPSSGERSRGSDILSASYALIYLMSDMLHQSLHAPVRGHAVASIAARAGPVEARETRDSYLQTDTKAHGVPLPNRAPTNRPSDNNLSVVN